MRPADRWTNRGGEGLSLSLFLSFSLSLPLSLSHTHTHTHQPAPLCSPGLYHITAVAVRELPGLFTCLSLAHLSWLQWRFDSSSASDVLISALENDFQVSTGMSSLLQPTAVSLSKALILHLAPRCLCESLPVSAAFHSSPLPMFMS